MLITVGLPLWQAEPIVWLALESLARQQDAGEWELVYCEEAGQAANVAIGYYAERLKAAECVASVESPVVEWTPLGRKWQLITEDAHPKSKALLLQAADCYSYPHRIHDTKVMIERGATWIQSARGPFYNIKTATLRMFDRTTCRYPTGLNLAIEMKAMRALAPIDAARGADGALWNALRTMSGFTWAELEGCTAPPRGLDTHGCNMISTRRGGRIERCEPPFVETVLRLSDCVPDDVAVRLEHMREEVTA